MNFIRIVIIFFVLVAPWTQVGGSSEESSGGSGSNNSGESQGSEDKSNESNGSSSGEDSDDSGGGEEEDSDESGDDSKSESEEKSGSDSKSESKEDSGSDSKSESEEESGSNSKSESEEKSGSDSKSESEEESGSDSKSESEEKSGSDSKSESEEESGSNSKSESEVKSEENSESESRGESGGKSGGESGDDVKGDPEPLKQKESMLFETLFKGEAKTFEGDFVDMNIVTPGGCSIMCHREEHCLSFAFDTSTKVCRYFVKITSSTPVAAPSEGMRSYGSSLKGWGLLGNQVLSVLEPAPPSVQEAKCNGAVYTPYDASDANYLFVRYGNIRVGLQRISGVWRDHGDTAPTGTILWAASYPQDGLGDCAFISDGRIVNEVCKNATALCLNK